MYTNNATSTDSSLRGHFFFAWSPICLLLLLLFFFKLHFTSLRGCPLSQKKNPPNRGPKVCQGAAAALCDRDQYRAHAGHPHPGHTFVPTSIEGSVYRSCALLLATDTPYLDCLLSASLSTITAVPLSM
jgi:hypothetical protein